ncbi:hypothetical protein H6F88_17350 [Oculatella sp. FACHB-28]|nr:hypothetical protein [Leptolyngbya sp. FACHB-541]MBD2057764.1 hypothetical protein [Oculatella sp. FACHB-28]MBD2069767.1 hypothetical protein [Leptolyngbya sp. FACHB-671]
MLAFGSILAMTTILLTTRAALADFRVSNGTGGNYAYQLWRTDDGTQYYLKIWSRRSYPNGSHFQSGSFESSRDALNYFDCEYGGRSLPSCPN